MERSLQILLLDYAGTADTNNITIIVSNVDGHNIQDAASDMTVSTERAIAFTLVYVDSTQGWLLKHINMANYKDLRYVFPASSIASGTFNNRRIAASTTFLNTLHLLMIIKLLMIFLH